MTRVFYHTDTGGIYGVHPDGNVDVPEGVSFIDVPEAADAVPWPALPDGRPGSEHTSRVVDGALVLSDDLPPSNQDLADALAFQGAVFKAFALIVLDEVNILRTQAGLSERTVQQLKNAIAARM